MWPWNEARLLRVGGQLRVGGGPQRLCIRTHKRFVSTQVAEPHPGVDCHMSLVEFIYNTFHVEIYSSI